MKGSERGLDWREEMMEQVKAPWEKRKAGEQVGCDSRLMPTREGSDVQDAQSWRARNPSPGNWNTITRIATGHLFAVWT